MRHPNARLAELSPPAPFDPLEGKLRVPVPGPGSVPRTPLVNRLRTSGAGQVVTVLGPAGYGKTTALAQWADRDRRLFAWVSIEEDDNDPVVFSTCVASALSRIQPVDQVILDILGSRRRSTPRSLERLALALLAAPDPLVLVLDNVHRLQARECVRTVAVLAEQVPADSTLVLAGRALPRLPIARMRAAGRLFEVGIEELALSQREVSLLLRGQGVELEAARASEVRERTEGWAAGTRLAALALKDKSRKSGQLEGIRGDDRFVADYFDFEHLSRLSAKSVRFLTRTAVLERMCGSLCDAVLETGGSASALEARARENQFLVPLDQRREWYRYHHEFRDFLRAELERREPELVPQLERRAAAWYEANGLPEAAVSHARAAGDMDRLARLVGTLAVPLCSAGRAATVDVWLEWFDDERLLERYPAVGVVGAWVQILLSRPAAATRWLAAAERGRVGGDLPDGSRSLEPWLAVLRAAMCRDGVEQMGTDAEIAVRDLGVASAWRPVALLLLGVARVLLGEDDLGDESLADAAEVAESAGAADIRIVALAERSLLAAARGDELEAGTLAARARALIEEAQLRDHPMSAIGFAAAARASLRSRDVVKARAELLAAHALAPRLTHALPWHAVQTRLELSRADLVLLDASEAHGSLAEAAEILRRRPRLGVLAAQRETLDAEVARLLSSCDDRTTILTTAELRLLPLLTTHLSFREIAEQLDVSRNTVKTQAISVYRKLDASSRSEAIARATELGLVDLAVTAHVGEFTLTG